MEYRELGSTGMLVSEIGMGCEGFSEDDCRNAMRLFDAAEELGINYFDLYTSDPKVRASVGQALQGRREKFYIQSHLCSVWKNGQYMRTRRIDEVKAGMEEMLSLLGLKDNARLFTYYCPEGALAVTASTYVLENGAWVSTGQGTISWEEQEEENAQGVFSLLVREDRSFVLSLHGMGTSTFQSDPVTPPEEPLQYAQGWLGEEREIQLGEEIPVAFFVADSGTSMPSFTVEDYFTPESFQGMDTVQAVTLTFSQQP